MSTFSRGPTGEVPDTARHRALSAASRVRMLDMLRRADGGLTAAEVAEATGLHPSTVRAHLEQLAASGLAARGRTGDGTPGRPAWRYRAAAEPVMAAAPGPYRDLAAALVAHLARGEDDPHAAGVKAGRDWGRSLAATVDQPSAADRSSTVDRPSAPDRPTVLDPAATSVSGATGAVDGLVRVLDRLGFGPRIVDRPGPDAADVHLRSCPFVDLALANPDVVCGVHLGVIGGALGALGAPAAQTDLEPFGVPGACVVRVRSAGRRARTTAAPGTSAAPRTTAPTRPRTAP